MDRKCYVSARTVQTANKCSKSRPFAARHTPPPMPDLKKQNKITSKGIKTCTQKTGHPPVFEEIVQYGQHITLRLLDALEDQHPACIGQDDTYAVIVQKITSSVTPQ